jgi:hypothetical protein
MLSWINIYQNRYCFFYEKNHVFFLWVLTSRGVSEENSNAKLRFRNDDSQSRSNNQEEYELNLSGMILD